MLAMIYMASAAIGLLSAGPGQAVDPQSQAIETITGHGRQSGRGATVVAVTDGEPVLSFQEKVAAAISPRFSGQIEKKRACGHGSSCDPNLSRPAALGRP